MSMFRQIKSYTIRVVVKFYHLQIFIELVLIVITGGRKKSFIDRIIRYAALHIIYIEFVYICKIHIYFI